MSRCHYLIDIKYYYSYTFYKQEQCLVKTKTFKLLM